MEKKKLLNPETRERMVGGTGRQRGALLKEEEQGLGPEGSHPCCGTQSSRVCSEYARPCSLSFSLLLKSSRDTCWINSVKHGNSKRSVSPGERKGVVSR